MPSLFRLSCLLNVALQYYKDHAMEYSLTPRDRMVKALRGEKPDVTPAAPCYLSLFLADFLRAYYIEQYRRRMKGLSRCPIDHAEDTYFRAQAVYQSYGVFKSPPDWIEVGMGASKAWAERTDIVFRDDLLCYEDRLSGACVPMHSIPLPLGDVPLNEIKPVAHDALDRSAQFSSRADVDAQMPIMGAEELLARGNFDLPRLVAADYGDRYFISTILGTPFTDAYAVLGFRGLMVFQRRNPDVLHHILQRSLGQARETMSAWAETGITGIFAEEVFTGADIISPQSYDQFVFDYNQPYFEYMSSLNLLPTHYVCGDAVPRIERMMEYVIAAVAFEESKKKFQIEISEVVERVAGRKAVFGNVDAVRFGIHATPEEMTKEVKRQAGFGAQGCGFIVGTGSPFPLDTNPRNIDALVSAAHLL